jgi:hypothetical protein
MAAILQSRPVRSKKTLVGPETCKCYQEAPSRQRVATGDRPSHVDSCGKATLPAASGRKKAVNPLVKLHSLWNKFKGIFSEDVKPMEGPEVTIKPKSGTRPKRITHSSALSCSLAVWS